MLYSESPLFTTYMVYSAFLSTLLFVEDGFAAWADADLAEDAAADAAGAFPPDR